LKSYSDRKNKWKWCRDIFISCQNTRISSHFRMFCGSLPAKWSTEYQI